MRTAMTWILCTLRDKAAVRSSRGNDGWLAKLDTGDASWLVTGSKTSTGSIAEATRVL